MAFGRESGPGQGQPAEWKMPEKKPMNPAMMETTLRDVRKEFPETYADLPAPPVGDDGLPAFLGREIAPPRVESTSFELGDMEIDQLLEQVKEAKTEKPTPDQLAETLPSPRVERASDYKNVPPPVETQPPEQLGMRGEKLLIDGVEYHVPPVLDEAAKAILENPDLMDFEKTANEPDELAKFFPGLDAAAREQISSIFHLRSKLLKLQLQAASTPEMKDNLVRWNKRNLVESIKEEQNRTQERQKKRAA